MAQQILRLPELVRIAKGIDRSVTARAHRPQIRENDCVWRCHRDCVRSHCDLYCIGLGDQLVRHVSPVHHTNQNQTANNTAADTQVMISRRSSSDISRGPMLQSGQRATDRALDFVIRNCRSDRDRV